LADFDPYRKWLGIPPDEQPPNHYRLLGVGLFEADPDVIANAADRQMFHVRTFQAGQYSDISQFILNELAAARICLLEPQRKAEYDEWLRQTMQTQRPAVPPQAPPVAPPVVAPVAPPRPQPASPSMSPPLGPAMPAVGMPRAVPASSPLAAAGMFAYPGAGMASPPLPVPSPRPTPWAGPPALGPMLPGAVATAGVAPSGPLMAPPTAAAEEPDFLAAVSLPTKRAARVGRRKKKKMETLSIAIALLFASTFIAVCFYLLVRSAGLPWGPSLWRQEGQQQPADSDDAQAGRTGHKPAAGDKGAVNGALPVRGGEQHQPAKVIAAPASPGAGPANVGKEEVADIPFVPVLEQPGPIAAKPARKHAKKKKLPIEDPDAQLADDEDLKPGGLDPNAPNIQAAQDAQPDAAGKAAAKKADVKKADARKPIAKKPEAKPGDQPPDKAQPPAAKRDAAKPDAKPAKAQPGPATSPERESVDAAVGPGK
jgi:hypothetical protein